MKGYKSNYDIEIGECSKNTPKLHVYAGLVEGVKLLHWPTLQLRP